MPDSHILYELLVYTEWKRDVELVSKLDEDRWTYNWFRSFDWRKNSAGSQHIEKLVNHTLPWRMSVGADGRAVALVQESTVEVLSSKDEYSLPLGKANLWKDPFPQWRQVTWSPDDSVLAVAHSNGSIEFFDLLATPLFTIDNNASSITAHTFPHSTAVASLVFTDIRTKTQHWNWELLVLDYTGILKSFYISPLEGFQLNHEFSFTSFYPYGVTALALNSCQPCLYIAGVGSESGLESENEDAQVHGITAWRILNDDPYYKPILSITPTKTSFIKAPSLHRWKSAEERFCVWKMVISPDGKQLVTIHNNGLISLWMLPSLKCHTKWPLVSQGGFDELSPALLSLPASKRKRCSALLFPQWCHPTDVNWWDPQAVIIARFSGAVSVYSLGDGHNLLGASPEFFDGVPQVSAASEGCFLGLECESNIVPKKKPKIEGMEDDFDAYEAESLSETGLEEDDEEEGTLWKTSSHVVRSALYWITDSERFQPPKKRAKLVKKTYRLLALKRTTPADLYARKLDEEEYGEALALARAYGLDCDLVYQRQWRNHPASLPNIQHYLSKISKRSWVLKECLERVPDDPDAARELLLYGLKGTDVPALYAIGEGKDGGCFITTLDSNHALEDELDDEFARQEAERNRQLLTQINWSQLNLEQRHLVETRRRLWQYLDRLALYELILGGPHRSGESFDAQYFAQFRTLTALEAGAEFARNGEWQALALLWTYQGQSSLWHRLPLLSCFPETTPPFHYRTLLPECDVDGQVYLWDQQLLRPLDWSESEECKKVLLDEELRWREAEAIFYESDPTLDLAAFKTSNDELSGSLVSLWYVRRSRVIEMRSGQIENALDLIRLGRERNVEGLDEIYHKLVTLETLVYELDMEHLTLECYEKLSDLEIVSYLLSKCNEGNLADCLNRWLLPYLRRSEALRPGSRASLLKEYLVNQSQRDLTLPVLFVEHSKIDVEEPIIETVTDLLQVAVDCLYSYTHTDQLTLAFSLYDCLPERGYIRQNVSLSQAEEKNLKHLHDLLDAAEKHLEAAQLLEKHGVPLILSSVRQSSENASEAEQILHLLMKKASHRSPALTLTEWKELLQDMLQLQHRVFKLINPNTCKKVWIRTLLGSKNKESMKLAASYMDLEQLPTSIHTKDNVNRKIAYEESAQLVLEAAQDYFDTSENVADPALDLSSFCLMLIPSPDERIQEELNLILALQSLHTYGLNIPPLRIRHTPDRLSLVQQVLQQHSQAYKNTSRLLHLARVLSPLRLKTATLESLVLIMVAQAALTAADFETGYTACQKLMVQGAGVGWEICTKLSQAPKFKNKDAQMELVSYALCYCPSEVIQELLEHKRSLERQRVTDVMKYNVGTLATLGIDDLDFLELLDEDVKKPVLKENGNQTWNETVLMNKARQTTKHVMESTAQTTKRFLDTVKRGTSKMHASSQIDQVELGNDSEADYHSLGLPFFYHAAWMSFPTVKLHSSHLEASYASFAPPKWEGNIQVQLLAQQLRLSLLQSNDYTANSRVVLMLAELVFAEDVTLALGLLLTLPKPSQAWEVFLKLPTTELTLQIAAFYFALQINQTEEQGSSLLFRTPYEVVLLAANASHVSKTLSETEYVECKALLNRCLALLADVAQARQLRQLDSGVDVDRFAAEDEYKKDTIVGLAITTDSAVYSSAVKLAQRYAIPLWEVAYSHLTALILEEALPVYEVERRFIELDLLKTLLQQPAILIERMESEVFPSLNGQDFARLLFYYRILDEATSKTQFKWENHPEPSVCLHLLNKLKNMKAVLDWKKMISGKDQFLRELKATITTENVSTLAKLAQNCDIRAGAVYAVYAQKTFFHVNSGSKGPQSLADWSHRYESLHDSLTKIDHPQDFVDFVNGLCFSEEALNRLNVEVRREILKRTVKHARHVQSKEKDLTRKEAWEKGRQQLSAWMEHLERLLEQECEDLRHHTDPVIKKLFREFDQSRSEQEKVQHLLLKVILDHQPIDFLKQFIALLPPDLAVTPEDLLMDALHECLNHLSGSSSSLLENADAVVSLGHILEEVQKGLDEGGPLGEEDVLSALREFTENDAVDVSVRLRVLSVVPKSLTLEDWAGSRAVLFNTISLLQKAWPEIDYRDVKGALEDEQARYKFFCKLLDAQDLEENGIIALAEILQLWPPFLHETESHPWLLFVRKALANKVGNETWNSVVEGALRNVDDLPQKVLEAIYEIMCSIQNLRLRLLIALKAHIQHIEEDVIQHLASLSEIPAEVYEEKVLALVLEANWEARLVNTPLYPRLMAHVLTLDSAAQNRTVQALSEANYRAELGAFIEQARGIPRGLVNFAASLLAGKPKK